MSKKRSKNGRVVGFIVIIIAALFLSSFGGFEFAEKRSNSQNEKITASNEQAAKDKLKQQEAAKKKAEEKLPPDAKVAYLTFDDGPSANVTPRVLNTLKQNNIKATFFILGGMAQQNPGLLKQEKAAGHTIGNHTYSHDYKYLYSNPDNFINDLKKNETVISSIIGDHDKTLIRFPGGSFRLTTCQKAATAAGYHYIDWNVETGDAERQHASVDFLLGNLKKELVGQKKVVILMHDAATKKTTADALPQVIDILKSQGYQFRPMTSDSYNVLKR